MIILFRQGRKVATYEGFVSLTIYEGKITIYDGKITIYDGKIFSKPSCVGSQVMAIVAIGTTLK